jgi:hypothetical protein
MVTSTRYVAYFISYDNVPCFSCAIPYITGLEWPRVGGDEGESEGWALPQPIQKRVTTYFPNANPPIATHRSL